MGFEFFRRKIFITAIGIFLTAGISMASADESIRIAVLDFEANNASVYAAKAVSEFVSTEMAKKQEVALVERAQIGTILNEQGFQQTGCTEQECAVEMGKLLSARKILLGTLAKTGSVFVLTAKCVDVETGRIEFAESERCSKEEDLDLASRILAVKLVNHIAGTSYSIPYRTYSQDENRNRFALGFFYRYGMVSGISAPVLSAAFNGDSLESLKIASGEADMVNQSIIIAPSYEFTDNFALRMDFKYMFSKLKGEYSNFNPHDYGSDFSYTDMEFEAGYGVALNVQLIYPIEVFRFYLTPGIGIDKYSLRNPIGSVGYNLYGSTYPYWSYRESADIEVKGGCLCISV